MDGQTIDARRWWILAALCLSALVIAFDLTIVNVALPALVRAFAATASQLQWIVDTYTLAFAGLLLTTGSLGDRYGRKRALLAGLALFGVGSALAATADSAAHLILIRGLMGAGAALIMPSTLAIVAVVFPPAERARAIGICTAIVALGIPVGPIIGGWLLDRYSWHAVFLINLPIVVLALGASLILVPESRDARATALDPPGTVLSIAGLTALLWAIIEAPTRGWTNGAVLGALAAGAAALALALALFLSWEAHCAQPLLDLRLFANPRFSAAIVSVTLVYFSLVGALFFVTQYLQFVLGYTALGAGVRIIPLAAGLGAGAPMGGVLVARLGVRFVVAGGLLVAAGGLAVLLTLTMSSGYAPVAVALALFGLGMGLAAAPATDAIMGAAPPGRVGVASAVNDTTQETGGALGAAVMGSVLASAYSVALTPAVRGLPAPLVTLARAGLGDALLVAQRLGGGAGRELAAAARAAFIHAMTDAALVGVTVALAGAVVAALFLPPRTVAAPAMASGPARERSVS